MHKHPTGNFRPYAALPASSPNQTRHVGNSGSSSIYPRLINRARPYSSCLLRGLRFERSAVMYRTDRRPGKKWPRVSLGATSKIYFLMLRLLQASTQVSNVRARAYCSRTGTRSRQPCPRLDRHLLLLLTTSKSAILPTPSSIRDLTTCQGPTPTRPTGPLLPWAPLLSTGSSSAC